MKKLSLIVTALAVSGALELAYAGNHHINATNNVTKISSPVTDTVPGKKQKKRKDTTNPVPNSTTPNSNTAPYPNSSPTPGTAPSSSPSPSSTPTPSTSPTPSTTPSTSPTPAPNSSPSTPPNP